MSETSIRIYISRHKPCECAQSEIVRPVMQADVVRELEAGGEEDRLMAGRANEYCELLTQYWAWKNCNADYVGFGHYRRYFSFAEGVNPSGDGIIRRLFLNSETSRELSLADDAAISRALEGCDVFAPYPVEYPVGSAYEQYRRSDVLQIGDLDLVLRIIEREFPAYHSAAKKYMRGRRLFYCNMFVMRRELFLEYSEWLFSILRRFYECRDMRAAGYTAAQLRTPGHLGERLFGIWLTALKMRGGAKIRYGRMAVFDNADIVSPLRPGEGLHLFFPADARSAPFSGVSARSAALSAGAPLDIVFLENGLTAEDRRKLSECAGGCAGAEVRFFDAARVFSPCASSRAEVRFQPSRLSAFFSGFGQILYADGRTLFLAGIPKSEGEGVWDISEKGERMPARAEKEYYPSKGYSEAFWRIFRETPFFDDKDRAKRYGEERNLFWRVVFAVFPESGKTGSFLRKARKHLRGRR